jgi:uncharacterized protein (TIGR03083 family)
MVDPQTAATLFRDTRQRIIALASTLDASQLAARVPACPKWTVRELLAHLAGATADVVNGNLSGAPDDEWTAAQITARADRTVPELLDELAELGPRWEEIVLAGSHPSFIVRNAFLDSGVHEADLHGALGLKRPPAEVPAAIAAVVMPRRGRMFDGAGSFTVVTPEETYTFGTGPEAATVRVDSYELCRALFGRRSRAQVEAWDWEGSPGEFGARVSVFPQTKVDVVD